MTFVTPEIYSIVPSDSSFGKRAAQSRQYALTYQKHMIGGKTYQSSTIELHDTEDDKLRKFLGTVREKSRPSYYKGELVNFPSIIYWPFEEIVWLWDDLQKARSSDSSQLSGQPKDDLGTLLDFVEADPSLGTYFQAREQRPTKITWDNVWTLFPVGTEFVAELFLETPQLFVCLEPQDDVSHKDSPRKDYWTIEGWCYDYNGEHWLRVCHRFEIKKFDREKTITDLPFYPLGYAKDPAETRRTCLENGENFKKAALATIRPRFMYNEQMMVDKHARSRGLFAFGGGGVRKAYTNDAVSTYVDDAEAVSLVISKATKQEVIVDPELWYEQHSNLHIGSSAPFEVYAEGEEQDDNFLGNNPEGDLVRFCPPRFLGCIPKERIIGQFRVSEAKDENEVREDPGLFKDTLQLEQNTKNLLLAQVTSAAKNVDIISGKGDALVILLHGPPGVGKTLTAETICRATNKPLLNTSVSDIGMRPEHAEERLKKIFAVASRWQSVLLIDEADAFLEARSAHTAPERNAFVTVMLRVLEYHNGIVILTTNRLTSLDTAVQSRIHLAVSYGNLEVKQCRAIFENTLNNFCKNTDVKCEPEERQKMLKWFEDVLEYDGESLRLNGREIRNLVSGAIATMKWAQDPYLTTDQHVKKVFSSIKAFQRQLKEKTEEWKREN